MLLFMWALLLMLSTLWMSLALSPSSSSKSWVMEWTETIASTQYRFYMNNPTGHKPAGPSVAIRKSQTPTSHAIGARFSPFVRPKAMCTPEQIELGRQQHKGPIPPCARHPRHLSFQTPSFSGHFAHTCLSCPPAGQHDRKSGKRMKRPATATATAAGTNTHQTR